MTYIATGMAPGWDKVMVWERNQTNGRRELKKYTAPYYFFVADEEGEFKDIHQKPLRKLEFSNSKIFRETAENFRNAGEKLYESDISTESKVLAKHYFGKPIGKLNTTFFDIEVDFDKTKGFAGPENPYAPINAVAIYHQHQDKMIVYAVPPDGQHWTIDMIPAELQELAEVVLCVNEKQLLRYLLEEFEDSDIISGWNSEGYDVPYVYERIKRVLGESAANKLSFNDARPPKYKEIKDQYGTTRQRLDIFGRVHIDFLQLFFKFEPGGRDSYTLEAVADEELDGMEKLHYEGSLADLYRNDFVHFIRYNVRDCEILKGLENLKGYMMLAVMLSHMDACRVDDVLGTIKITEAAIINHCHTHGMRVPDTNRDAGDGGGKFGGAFVLSPQAGLHEMLASIDVTSLYPSAMRTVNISPDTLVGNFINYSDDYERLLRNTGQSITARFEDGSEVEMTTDQWSDYLRENKYAISGYGVIFDQSKQGFIPALLEFWFEERKKYKAKAAVAKKEFKRLKEAGDPRWREVEDQFKYFDKTQNIFKLKLNSTYGACGNRFFKFYDIRLAESTTKTGREVLMHMARKIGEVLEGDYHYPNKSVIYGDTDSCYFKTYGSDIEEALKIANLIARTINKSFPAFCREQFYCNDGFDDLVKVAQEIVAARSIFIAGKKGYMMHVLKDEGQDVDKIKITGLQIKKTTMPKPIREFVTDAFSAFLRGEGWITVGLRLLEYKEKLLATKDIAEIGLPMRVKNMESYIERMNNNEPGLSVPGHVRASILFNACLEQYEDTATMRIVSGMRVRVFYLKKPIGKFKAIALPFDIDVIPDWFNEHFHQRINRNMQIEKLIDTRLASMLLAIDEIIPTRKGLLIDELFE